MPEQEQVDSEQPSWLGEAIELGERVALVLNDTGGIRSSAVVPVAVVEQWAVTYTLPDEGDVPRPHYGFGVFPNRGGGRQCIPMRLEFPYQSPAEPVEAVFDLENGLTGRYRFDVANGHARFLDLTVTAARDVGDADPLRRLNLGVLRDQLTAWLRHPLFVAHTGQGVSVTPRRPGRRGSDPLMYALWARRYVRALRIDSRRPARVIVDEAAAAGEHVTLKQVNNAVRRARNLGLLTKGKVGAAGGELTPEAKRHLREGGVDDTNNGGD